MSRRFRAALLVLAGLLLLGGGRAARGAPPAIDATPALGPSLVQERWQSLLVRLTNPDTGTALQGEVQVTLEDPRTGGRLATYTRPVTLPRGAGAATVPVTLFIPENRQPDVFVYVVNGRDGSGEVVTRRKIEKLPITPAALTLVAVSGRPDALAYLQGETFGVMHTGGVLAPFAPNNAQVPVRGRSGRQPIGAAPPLQVSTVSDPANLPDRPAAYDAVGAVYLGADIPPDALSDTQTDALRGWVAGGGFVVTAGDRWRQDERFRPWLPATPDATSAGRRTHRRYGRGSVTSLVFDATAPENTQAADAVPFWRNVFQEGTAPRSVGRILSAGAPYYFNSFAATVLRAPGLKAPGYGYVGVFLVTYLALLVPVNYLVLKRLDRREWSWVTIPVLVLAFSLGAYGFGYATKGGRMVLNTASVVEMGSGSGDALVHTMAGVFAPARARYQVSCDLPDAVLWSPQYGFRAEFEPFALGETENAGATARDAEIPMWGMRVFGARSGRLKLGDGLAVRTTRVGDRVTVSVTNRTGRRLEQVVLKTRDHSETFDALEPSQTVTVRFTSDRKHRIASARPWIAVPGGDGLRTGIGSSLKEAASSNLTDLPDDSLFLSAWNFDPLVPLRVDGTVPQANTVVNLILVNSRIQP